MVYIIIVTMRKERQMLTQKQLTTQEQFKAHFDAMLTNNFDGRFVFEHKGYNYALVNLADEVDNKIMCTNLWDNIEYWDDFFWNKEKDNAGDITSELAWMEFDRDCYGNE